MVLVLLSCGREPSTGPMRTPGGVARGLSFNAIFPPMPNLAAFAALLDFDRVRVLLRHADGTVALDTLVNFPAGVDAITLSFDVQLAAGTPAAGELLKLNLAYLNAAGDTVFRGGPVELRAAAAIEGAPPPPPVSIPVVYTGREKTVRISPRTLTVNAGQPFAFTAVASDSTGAAVATALVVWVTPDPTIANIPVPTAGAGTANAARGTARIIAQLFSGASDTVSLTVIPVATAIGVASGNNQSGVIGKPAIQVLAQPIAARVTAGDGLGVPGVSVTFAAANGGSVSPTTVVTDAAGLAQTTWSLGTSAATQTATATVATLAGSPVTFNATGAAKPATRLVLTSGPVTGANIPSGTPTPLVVAAQDADGDPALGFTGDVTVALSANPAGGALAGTATVAAVGGTASLPAISIAKPGAGYVLQATSGTLTPVSTNAFNIVTGPAANLTLVSGGGQTAEAGAALLPIKVLVTDVNGNPKAGATVAFAPGGSFGTVAPASAVTGADGTATTTWTLGTPVGTQLLDASTTGVATLAVSATAVAVVRQWFVTQQPAASLTAGAAISPAVAVELRDAFGKVVPSFTGATTIAIGANPGSSTLGGTLTVNAVAGVVSFAGLSLNKSATGYTLVVSAAGTTLATTNTFNVTAATPATLEILSGNAQTGAAGSALAQPVVAKLTDSFGNPIAATSVTFAVSAGGGSVTPATGSTDAAGQLSTVWTLGSAAAAQTLSITSAGVAAVTATATATSATRTLVVTQQPGTTQTAGVALTPVVSAEMRDGFNALVPSFTGPVTIAIGANPGSATLGGTTTVSAVAGVASFPGLSLNKSGTGYTLATASSGATSATTTAFNVTAAAPATLAIVSGNAQTGAAGSALAQPVVAKLTDSFGNPIAATSVTFAVSAGGGSVTPATGSTDAAGQLSTVWTLGSAAAAQTLSITSAGVAAVTATATATSATRTLVVTQQPGTTQTAGVALTPVVTVEMRDGFNALVPSFTGAVTMAIGSNCCGAALSGTATVDAVGGVASFPGLSLNKRGGGYTLSASATGATSAATTAFVVSSAPAKLIVVTSGNGQSGAAGAALATPVVAFVTDNFGNGVAATTVAIKVRTGGGSVTPVSASTDSTGRVSATWTLGSGSITQLLDFTLAGVDSTTATATTSSGATLAWVITTQPGSTQTAGATITPGLVAEQRDGAGAVVTTFNGTATLSLASNPAGGTLAGTTSVSAANGIATFSNTSISKAGAYTVDVGSSGATAAVSTAFNIVAAAASAVAVESGGSQTGTFGSMLAAPVVLKVVDGFGNPVTGTAVTFAVTSGGGSVGTPSATTNASGQASTTWTLGPSGPQMISGTSTGLTGSPLTISAVTASGSVNRTVVSPRNDTLTSLGATRALSAQARDVSDGIVAGSFSWVSRDPSIATVSSGGVVTAIANGSTYVVAMEIGGTRDSALMVVQQRTASVNITPGSRALYTGGTFTYTALAVDGRGNAMSAQPVFAWSSTSPSVASVDAGTGLVTALALGSTQIRASAGSTTGVSPLTVQTPITRIDVTFDSASAAAPDTFTMAALGLRRTYRAIARDTLLNVMSGVTFTWSSSNASVAAIDTARATTAGAISAANGVTSIQASAQGVTGKATLYVAQVLSSIELTPVSIIIGMNGSTTMLARGKDSQGRYISGGTFTYATSNGAFVSVNASTGVATGVANGSANITATSGLITSNTALVSVSSEGSSVISFGRDTIGVGRGNSVSVPILLSRPRLTPLTVNLSAADTNAYWSTATITIAANATSGSAILNGRNAGSITVTALDGSGAGYSGDTAVVAVQANIRMATSSYSMNATDEVATQVLLSDPSPVGGTYVTFSYGTGGKASASPDPAFIPAGQLAADVVIRGLVAGTTSMTPVATGVNGTAATVYVSAAVLNVGSSSMRLGAGQYQQYQYVYTPNGVRNALVVGLASSDSTIANTAPTVTIPTNYNYQYFQVNAFAPGSAQITASATGWAASTFTVVTTTPKLTICCAYGLNSSGGAQNMTIYVGDSLGGVNNRLSSLSVRMSSSDTSVIKVLDTLGTIAAGANSSTLRIMPAGAGGTAWIKVTAGGHTADSTKITVVGPALSLGYSTTRLGTGQVNPNQYVSIPNAIATALTIRLANSDTTVAATDTLLTIPAGQSYVYYDVRGRGTGTSTVIASAPGYTPDTASHVVTTPRLQIVGTSSLNAYSLYSQNVYVEDSVGSAHNRMSSLALSLRSSDPTVLSIDSVATVPAGYYYVPSGIAMSALKPGTVWIYVSAAGHPTDSLLMTVQPAKLNLSFTTYDIGAHQTQPASSFYAYTPNGRPVPVEVSFVHSNPSVLTLSSTVDTIPANSNVAYFGFSALIPGRDTIIASAVGYQPDTAIVRVSSPKLLAYLPSTATTTSPPGTATIYATDSLSGAVHYVSDTLVLHAVTSDSNVIRPTQEYFRIPKGEYYAYPLVQYVGPGTATMTYSDSAGLGYIPATSSAVTVVGPSLNISGANPGKLGTGQHSSPSSYYVYIPNPLGTPLTVNLVSTDPRVATVPASVTIPAGSTYQYFTITAQDTIGTVQIQATATGYTLSSVNMKVTPPKFMMSVSTSLYTTSPPTGIFVYAADEDGTGHYVNQDVVVTLGSSAPGVASVDSSTITIVVDQYYSNIAKWSPGSVGTAQLTASDARSIRFPYGTAAQNVSVSTPPSYLSFGTLSLAPGQYLTGNYVSIPNTRTGSTLTVPLSHSAAPRTNTPVSVDIAAGSNSASFRVDGTSVGSDTITASPAGHIPSVGVVNVGLGTLDPLSGWQTAMTVGDSAQVTLYTRAPDTGSRYVSASTIFTLSPASNVQFVSGGAAGSSVVITSLTVPIDAYYTTFWVKAIATGSGNSSISNANYVTYTNSVSVSGIP